MKPSFRIQEMAKVIERWKERAETSEKRVEELEADLAARKCVRLSLSTIQSRRHIIQTLEAQGIVVEDGDYDLSTRSRFTTLIPVYQMRLLDGGQCSDEWVEVTKKEYETPTTEKFGKWERRKLYKSIQKCVHNWISSEGRTSSGWVCIVCGDYGGPDD